MVVRDGNEIMDGLTLMDGYRLITPPPVSGPRVEGNPSVTFDSFAAYFT